MKSRVLRLVVFVSLLAGLLGVPATGSLAVDPPDNVAKLKEGLMALAGWIDSLGAEGKLGRPLPLLRETPGEELHLGPQEGPPAVDGVFDKALKQSLQPTSPTSIQDIITTLTSASQSYTLGGDQLSVTFATSNVDDSATAGDTITGFDLTATVERALDAATLQVQTSSPEMTLRSIGGSGVPTKLTFQASFKVRAHDEADDSRDHFFVEAASGTPSFSATADSLQAVGGAEGTYTLPSASFESAVGFGDLRLDQSSASTFALDATFPGTIADTNNDGKLAFTEPGNPGGPPIPAELSLPPNNLVTIGRQGSVATTINLDSPLVSGDQDAVVSVNEALTGSGEPSPTATGADVGMLEDFENVRAVDVLGGLIQYATLLRAMQTHRNADFDLPMASGRFSDVFQAQEEIAKFIDARVVDLPPGTFPDLEVGDLVDFTTALDLAKKMSDNSATEGIPNLQDTNGADAGDISPVYDPTTKRLRFDIHVSKETTTFADIPEPPVPTGDAPPAEQGSEVGIVNFGDTLRATTGLAGGAPSETSNTQTNPASQAERKVDYEFRLPFFVNLVDATAAADDPATDGVVEFESPMVFERFHVETGGSNEMKLSGAVRTPINVVGQIGFVRVNVVSNNGADSYLLTPKTADPILTLDLNAVTSGLDADPRIPALLRAMQDGAAADDPVAQVSPGAQLDLAFRMRPFSKEGYALTDDFGNVTVDWGDIASPLPNSGVTLQDDTARMLKALDIVPPSATDPDGDPGALLGKLVDTVQNATTKVEEKLDDIPQFAGVDLVDTDIPLLGSSINDLFKKVASVTENGTTRSVSLATLVKEKLDKIRSGPLPFSLQELEKAIQDELNLPANALNFAIKDFGGDPNSPELIFRLRVERQLNETLPLNVDLGFGDVVGLQGSGALNLTGGGTLDLNVPVTLSAPTGNELTGPVQVLDSSGLGLNVNIDTPPGTPPQLTASLGPLSIGLGDGTRGAVKGGAAFTAYAGTDGAQVPQGSEQPMNIDDFIAAVSPRLGPGAASPFDCTQPEAATGTPDPPTVSGTLACAALPVLVNGKPVFDADGDPNTDQPNDTDGSYLTVAVNGLGGGDVQINAPSGLQARLLSEALNFTSLKDGLAKLKAVLDLALQGATYGAELPLVGEQIAAGAKAVDKFKTFVDTLTAPTFNDPSIALDNVSNQIRTAIAGALPAGILRDSDYATTGFYYAGDTSVATADKEDIRVVMQCGGGDCPSGSTLLDLDQLTVEFEIGQGPRNVATGACADTPNEPACEPSVAIPIDLGLPGINFGRPNNSQQVQASAGWSLQLGFGVSRDDGFFLLDNPLPSSGTPDDYNNESEQELKVGFGVGFQQNPTDDELSAQLGFLDVGVEDHPGERNTSTEENHDSRLSALLSGDLRVPGATSSCFGPAAQQTCSAKLTIDQIPGLQVTELLNPRIAAEADIDLQLTSGLSGTVGAKLPRLRADLLMNWQLGQPPPSGVVDPDCTSAGDGGNTGSASVALTNPGTPAVCFQGIGIDPGTLYAQTLAPIFDGVKGLTKPVDPIREFIFSPVPVISDASRLFGGDDITYVDLAAFFGDFDPSLLKDINAVIDVVNNFPTASGQFMAIGDGEFKVDGARAVQAPTTPEQTTSLIKNASAEMTQANSNPLLDDAQGKVTSNQDSKDKFNKALNKNGEQAGDGDADISIPILEEPGCVFGMMFGGDCGLFEWNPEPMRLDFNYEQSIGPFFGVVYVTFGGFAGAQARLSIGYDTRGFRELFEGGMTDAGSLLNGIYINDLASDGSDPAELEVWAGITAGAKLSVVVAEAGARGGIQATVGLNWHDGPEIDGVLRINEIVSKIRVPFCLFDVQGRLEAFLEVYLTLGVCPFCAEYSHELARVILLDFSEGFCPDQPPNLANSDGNVVTLNVGGGASARGPDWGAATVGEDENFVVRQLSPPGTSPKKFSITAFGYTEEETGNEILIPNAAGGNDVFLFQGAKAGAQPGQTTQSTDGTAPFTAKVTATTLGPGNDSIVTGDGNDVVNGGTGNDNIVTGGGNDQATGGPSTAPDATTEDNDTIVTGDGNDNPVNGGYGNDTMDGGLGQDTLNGGAGADRIDGGRDVVVKPNVATPCASVPAGAPCDRFDVGDTITGGADGDQIDGGNGGDTISGDETLSNDNDGAATGGNDVITGGLGSDTVYAGNGADDVTGGATSPIVDESIDYLHGNGGADKMSGDKGNDEMFGGSGADTLNGNLGDDDIQGQGGNDTAFGNEGSDDIYGNADDDDLFGNAGDDNLFGNENSDALFGAAGNDDLDGGSGNDRKSDGGGLFGNEGDDDIKGGSGQDDLFGGVGIDFMMGDDGTIDDSDPANRTGAPNESSGDPDELYGESEADVMWGEGSNDRLEGGPADDLMFGNGGDDDMFGQTGSDKMIGGSKRDDASDVGDDMFGGTENDTMIGDNGSINSPVDLGPTGLSGTFGDDTMNGGPDQDLMYGQEGDDTMYGAEAYDRMFGNLGGDDMFGEDGPDYMLGDSGTVDASSDAPATWPGGAPNNDVSLDAADDTEGPNDGGIDTMDGGAADDHMYGGAADDIMSGGGADDYMEGNNGRDRMFGYAQAAESGDALALNLLFDGEDDLIGGSSPVNPLTATPAGADDEGEIEMFGNAKQDVIAGDNAVITRTVDPTDATAWAIDNITGGAQRQVELLDTEKTGAALQVVSGDDTMLGNAQNDRIYGEGGNDCGKGNSEEDYLEGNQDRDWLEGNADQDDIIGGSDTAAKPDDGDYLFGGGAADVISGDNAVITRDEAEPGPPYDYRTSRIVSEMPTPRFVKFNDLDNPDFASAAGPDQVSGGQGSDVMFGQDEGDLLSGGTEGDHMQGQGDIDFLFGDRTLVEVDAAPPAELVGGVPDVIAALAACASPEADLNGPAGTHGQDDQIGGISIAGHRDQGDYIWGDGAQDFQLGDNGDIVRRFTTEAKTAYKVFEDYNPSTFVRKAKRFDVGGPVTVSGDDYFEGNDGDDYQWGQDGDDIMHGNAHNDDMYGELGADRMFGEDGEDAMVGDRGVITDDLIEVGDPDDPSQFTITTTSPPFVTYTAFRPGTLHRQVDLIADGDGDVDGDGDPIEKPGLSFGGGDFMRGGPDRDSMHGAFGDDLMNGDSDGDVLYGDDGSDVMWGGKGSPDPANPNDRGVNDEFVDILFGGYGGDPANDQGVITGGADVLDYRPRPGTDLTDPTVGSEDPDEWFEITSTDDDQAGNASSILNNNHHQGIDWIYGGWDRDVLQGDVSDNGPNQGDRLIDWNGAFNLYTHCNPAYGGYNDVRAHSPTMQDFLQRLAFSTGAGSVLDEVLTEGTSAFRELALVYPKDGKFNSDKAYPTTPGHFEDIACQP